MALVREAIMRVETATLGLLRSATPVPFIEASGATRTGGWHNAELVARNSPRPPADGIQDLDFLAEPPRGTSIPVVSQIAAPPYIFAEVPSWLRGVRIHAADNTVTRALSPRRKPLLHVDLADVTDPTPVGTSTSRFDGAAIEYDLLDDAVELVPVSGEHCHRFGLLSLAGWPDHMVRTETKHFRIENALMRVEVPVAYHRDSMLMIDAQACWPTTLKIAKEIEVAAKQALSAGMFARLVSEPVPAASVAMEAYVRAQLADRVGAVAGAIRIGIRRGRVCGAWRRV